MFGSAIISPTEVCESLPMNSSSAAIPDRPISARAPWRSSTSISRFTANSSSVGARCRVCSSSVIAVSMRRARDRTERGTQSRALNSSRIAPLIRLMA